MNFSCTLKNGEHIRLKFLSIGDLTGLGKMLASLSGDTRQFWRDRTPEVQNVKSRMKMCFLLLRRPLLNTWLYRVFRSYFVGIIALNDKKEVIGLAYLKIESHWTFKSATYGIVVRDDYQGKLVGTNLTRHAINVAKRIGVNVIRLTVHTENTRAIKLYRKFGFLIEEKIPDMNSYSMTLDLKMYSENWFNA